MRQKLYIMKLRNDKQIENFLFNNKNYFLNINRKIILQLFKYEKISIQEQEWYIIKIKMIIK